MGAGVKNVKAGDRVLVSCITECGACRFCREGHYGQCLGGGGWIVGHKIDGAQAEYVRVPFADDSTYPAPAGVRDEDLLMLADILPTGDEVGVLNGKIQPGDVVAALAALQELTGGPGADVAIEGRGRTGDVRPVHAADPSGWAGGQHRRPRRGGSTSR